MDLYFDSIFKIENKDFVSISEGEYGFVSDSGEEYDSSGHPIYQYIWNGQEMTESEYQSSLQSVFDTSRAVTIGRETSPDLHYTYDEIVAYLCGEKYTGTAELLPGDYVGMTIDDLVALWGNNFLCGEYWYLGAGKAIYYPDDRIPFVFYYIDLEYESSPKGTDIISIVRYAPKEGDNIDQIVQGIPANATYEQLIQLNVEGIFYDSAKNDVWMEALSETAMFSITDNNNIYIDFYWFDNHDPYTTPAEIIEISG